VKERLIVQELVDFIDNKDSVCPVALISGIRRIGKTTVLKQLASKYNDAVYIDMLSSKDGFAELYDRFLNNPTSLLLIDEITYLNEYDDMLAQTLYEMAAGEKGWRFKCIITGSSPAHMMKLQRYRLGGGRSKLFRLLPITFIEYLHFTERISDYTKIGDVTANDFINYLKLEGLQPDLRIVFDREYFETYYNETLSSNENSRLNASQIDISPNELLALTDLLAYKLSEAIAYAKMLSPEVGKQELINVNQAGANLKWGRLDLSEALLSVSAAKQKSLSVETKIRIINFLLNSGLAVFETVNDGVDDPLDAHSLMRSLNHLGTHEDLASLFKNCSLHMVTPLFYSRLGEDIVNRMGIDLSYLYQGALLGKMLEVYVKGALSLYSPSLLLSSIKLSSSENGEVDVFLPYEMLMCEVTVGNKKFANINVNNYFRDKLVIRICSTKSVEDFINGMHRIPYAKLCALIDTKQVLNLEKTTVS
jgi:hypothetical protein